MQWASKHNTNSQSGDLQGWIALAFATIVQIVQESPTGGRELHTCLMKVFLRKKRLHYFLGVLNLPFEFATTYTKAKTIYSDYKNTFLQHFQKLMFNYRGNKSNLVAIMMIKRFNTNTNL